MKLVKDYGNAYSNYSKEDFCIFYKSTYELIKKRIYKQWTMPAFMTLAIIGNKFLFFPAVYRIRPCYEWILLIVGIISTALVILDDWYGPLPFATLCMLYLLGGVGWYIDKIIWAFGAIFSIITMLSLLELKNLSSYHRMAKMVINNRYVDENESEI